MGEEDTSLVHEQPFDLEQALISKKDTKNAFSVKREYVNSKIFHDKFEKLPVNKDVQQRLYEEAGRLLDFVDGQEQERMLAVDSKDGTLLVDNFAREGSVRGTGFTKKEAGIIEKCVNDVILIHSHSHNGRPSGQDFLTYLREDKVKWLFGHNCG